MSVIANIQRVENILRREIASLKRLEQDQKTVIIKFNDFSFEQKIHVGTKPARISLIARGLVKRAYTVETGLQALWV